MIRFFEMSNLVEGVRLNQEASMLLHYRLRELNSQAYVNEGGVMYREVELGQWQQGANKANSIVWLTDQVSIGMRQLQNWVNQLSRGFGRDLKIDETPDGMVWLIETKQEVQTLPQMRSS